MEEQQLPQSEELPEMHNLTGFFELLLTVDQRINPDLYTSNQNNQQNHD